VASLKQFKLPDVGEGLTEAEIVRWHVQPGDSVTQNQTICEIETAKALVELPSPFAGVVSELLVSEGTTVDVGTPIITVDVSSTTSTVDVAGDASAAPASTLASTEATPATDETSAGEVEESPEVNEGTGRTSVLVGYGPRNDAPVRRRASMPAFSSMSLPKSQMRSERRLR